MKQILKNAVENLNETKSWLFEKIKMINLLQTHQEKRGEVLN